MRWRPVDYQKYLSFNVGEEPLEALDERFRVQIPFKEAEVQLSASVDRREHVHGETTSRSDHDRCISYRSPGGSRVVIGPHPCFVGKEDAGPSADGLRTDLGILDRFPPSHLLGILLIRAHQWTLWRQPKSFQQ